MVETIIFQDVVFYSCKNYSFIVTFIMLILTCKLSMLPKKEAVLPQVVLSIVQFRCGASHVASRFVFPLYIHIPSL